MAVPVAARSASAGMTVARPVVAVGVAVAVAAVAAVAAAAAAAAAADVEGITVSLASRNAFSASIFAKEDGEDHDDKEETSTTTEAAAAAGIRARTSCWVTPSGDRKLRRNNTPMVVAEILAMRSSVRLSEEAIDSTTWPAGQIRCKNKQNNGNISSNAVARRIDESNLFVIKSVDQLAKTR